MACLRSRAISSQCTGESRARSGGQTIALPDVVCVAVVVHARTHSRRRLAQRPHVRSQEDSAAALPARPDPGAGARFLYLRNQLSG